MIKLTKLQKSILDFIEENKNSSSSQMASFFGVDKTTIQRNLKKLLKENKVSISGAGRSVIYYISPYNKIFEEVDVEEYFSVHYEKREVREGFNFEIFEILSGEIFTEDEREKMEELQKEFVKNFSRYDSQTLINKEFERIMIEFSWKSSAIEGNTYSLLGTEALIKENLREKNTTEAEAQMILNHKDAFNESIQNREKFLRLQYSDIEYIHTVLTKKLNISRNIRNLPVGISGSKYKPLDNAYQIKEALQKMTELINRKETFYEKSFLALGLLSYIQAFEDGNKRTARMFSNAILLAFNSIPLSYRIVDVVEYKKASLLFYEINNISYLKKIFIEQFEDAVKNYFN